MADKTTHDNTSRDASKSPSRKSKQPPLPPPPKFHSTTERLDGLESAPASASTSFIGGTGTLAELPPPPKMTGVSTTTSSFTMAAPTVVSVPPPPPPPPPPIVQEESLVEPSFPQKEELQEPTPLPRKVEFDILARRQARIPILVIATEAAHKLAWKNNLLLTDLFTSLAETCLVDDDDDHVPPLPPFRSVHRSMLLQTKHLKIDFLEPADYAQQQQESEFQSDATTTHTTRTNLNWPNVNQENDKLEKEVRNMLELDNDSNNTILSQVRRHEQLHQVSQEAFDLTSSPQHDEWLINYRAALDTACKSSLAPPLVLLVCSSNDFEAPVHCLRELSSPHFLPRQFHSGEFDKTSLRAEALVLHDAVDGNTVGIDFPQLKRELNQYFGGGAAIVKMNSIMPETAARMEASSHSNIWGDDVSRGACLSTQDVISLKRYLATMITSSLLPALERRISDLNFIVTDRKKGVKNVFKSLWRKPKEDGSSTTSTSPATTSSKPKPAVQHSAMETTDSKSSAIQYRCDSIESQVRLLADTLFLVRDWDAALGMYRLIKDDYKADKALLEYATVHEMMALATLALDPTGRANEAFSYMETALFSYTRAAEEERGIGAVPTTRPTHASRATQLATRLCLVMASATPVIQDRPLEVADLLASASSHETPLGAAVLLEQSSAHYYRAGMYRKYAFHMLMAGHMFRSALQEHHALRCFTSALYIYHDGRWDELHNHLRSALAAQLYSLGRMSVSVELYAKLVGTRSGGRVSVKSQQKFIQHLTEICLEHTEKAMVGADRMLATEHDVLKRVERMEGILETTPGAARVLELPNMDLPSVEDSTVQVKVESDQVHCDIPSFGTLGEGDPAVWEELKCETEAELKAVDPSIIIADDKPLLAKIEDPLIRRVVAAIDKQKANMNLLAKSKRSGNYKERPAVRARMEPLSVEFVMKNPLSIGIQVEGLQLVAKMTEAGTGRICTNEDAILIGPPSNDQGPRTFSGSSIVYETPEFCRISGTSSGSWTSTAPEEPFFVVSKYALALESNTSVRVTLGICPLVLGDMEVLGVRCKLFNDVWVYHPFDVKGPLLQNTSENRANRGKLL